MVAENIVGYLYGVDMTKEVMNWNDRVGGKKAERIPCPDGIEGCLVAHYKVIEEQPKQEQGEPAAYFNPQEGGFYWAKPTRIEAPITVDVEPLPLYTKPQTKGCDECGVGGGYALYCLVCAEKCVGNKEWVGLTDDEMFDCLVKFDPVAKRLPLGFKWFAEAIEAKLMEKNT
jgi:hypothetical protein